MTQKHETAASSSIKAFFQRRQHPIKILSYTTRSFWLLLIPLTRSLVAMRYDIAQWLKGSWLEILIIIVIFSYAFLRWISLSYRIEKDCIVARKGYFGLMESKIYYSQVSSFSVCQGPLYRAFRASKIFIGTNSGGHGNTDLKLTIKRSEAAKLFRLMNIKSHEQNKYSYHPKRRQLFIFSLIFSSSLSGVLVFTTLLIESAKIVNDKMEERIRLGIYEFTKRVENIAVNLSPIAVLVALVFLATWLLSFTVNLMRHWNFSSIRHGENLIIRSGIITKKSHIIRRNKIVYTDMRQNLLMKIFRICSVRIRCAGYGKRNRELDAIIPITTNDEVACSMKLLMPGMPLPKLTLRPRLRNIMRYLWSPIILSAVIPFTGITMRYFFPQWEDVIEFATFVLTIPAVWLVIVKTVSAFTTGIGFENGYIRLSYCNLYSFHTIIVPVENVSKISVYQTWAQFLKNNCSIKVYPTSKNAKPQRIKNFLTDDTFEIFRNNGFEL